MKKNMQIIRDLKCHLFLMVMAAIMLAACSGDDAFDTITDKQMEDGDGLYHYSMQFICPAPSWEGDNGDAGTGMRKSKKATSYTWEDGSTIYFWFTYCPGMATYTKSMDRWEVVTKNELNANGSQSECTAIYTVKPFPANSIFDDETGFQIVKSPYIGLFVDRKASYKVSTSGILEVNATLENMTWRMRFKGAANTKIKVSVANCDWVSASYSFYKGGSNITKWGEISNTELIVEESGYTPYIYASFKESEANHIVKVENDGKTYSRTLKTDDLKIGESGYFDIPTQSSHKGWSME